MHDWITRPRSNHFCVVCCENPPSRGFFGLCVAPLLTLSHRQHRGRPLAEDCSRVLAGLADLWGFKVRLETIGEDGGDVGSLEALPR